MAPSQETPKTTSFYRSRSWNGFARPGWAVQTLPGVILESTCFTPISLACPPSRCTTAITNYSLAKSWSSRSERQMVASMLAYILFPKDNTISSWAAAGYPKSTRQLSRWANGCGQGFRQLRGEELQTHPENYDVLLTTFALRQDRP